MHDLVMHYQLRWCLMRDGVCLRRSIQSWWRRCSPIRGTLWSTSGWQTRLTASLPAARLQPWIESKRWPSWRAWRSLLPMWGGFCVSNKPLHLQQLSTTASPLHPLYHSEKPFTKPNHGDAETSLGLQTRTPTESRERLAKAERGRPVVIVSVWSDRCLLYHWELLRWTFMKCRGVIFLKTDPFLPLLDTHTHTQVFCRRFSSSAFVCGFSRLGSSCVHSD